jgi:hypothetical protein
MHQLPPEAIRAALDAVALFGVELLMLSENCPRCGANLALVGRVHRCVASPAQDSLARNHVANAIVPRMANEGSATYRYRSPDKRRAYMAVYMREWRQRRKLALAAG